MANLEEVEKLLGEMIPVSLAEDWDNVGLMLGRSNKQIKRVLLALDLTRETAKQAIEMRADLIITHHPAIFRKLSQITDKHWQQDILLQLAEHGIAVYSAHTNLDCVSGGVNDALVKALNITDDEILDSESGLGRIGFVKPQPIEDLALFVKKALKADYVAVGNAGRRAHKVAVCGGAGSDLISIALAKGADTLITGDVKYHCAQEAVFNCMNVIDAGHQPTELPVLEVLADRLALRFAERSWHIDIRIATEALLLKHM